MGEADHVFAKINHFFEACTWSISHLYHPSKACSNGKTRLLARSCTSGVAFILFLELDILHNCGQVGESFESTQCAKFLYFLHTHFEWISSIYWCMQCLLLLSLSCACWVLASLHMIIFMYLKFNIHHARMKYCIKILKVFLCTFPVILTIFPITLHHKVPPTPYLHNIATPVSITNIYKCFTALFSSPSSFNYWSHFASAIEGEITFRSFLRFVPTMSLSVLSVFSRNDTWICEVKLV